MSKQDFSSLLQQHMRRIRASASGVACEIGLSRESVNNWKNGSSLPSQKHRNKLIHCAQYLRLTELETNEFFEAANFSSEYLLADSLPQILCDKYIGDLLKKLRDNLPYPITILLSQASWGEPPFRDAILSHASQHYGADKVLHIQPPFSLSAEPSEYFSQIGQQCGLDNIDSDYAFESALEKRLKSESSLFVMVSRFEQGVDLWREQLAGILRSLSEMYAGKLHILFCGGRKLADLKYQSGDLSLLNIANSEYWTELSEKEIQVMANFRYPSLDLNINNAKMILDICGGHPGLINQSLQLALEKPELKIEHYKTLLVQNDLLWQLFSPVMSKSSYRERLRTLLNEKDLGPHRPYLVDPLISALFWQNLITTRVINSVKKLVWRCPTIQQAGLQILAQW